MDENLLLSVSVCLALSACFGLLFCRCITFFMLQRYEELAPELDLSSGNGARLGFVEEVQRKQEEARRQRELKPWRPPPEAKVAAEREASREDEHNEQGLAV